MIILVISAFLYLKSLLRCQYGLVCVSFKKFVAHVVMIVYFIRTWASSSGCFGSKHNNHTCQSCLSICRQMIEQVQVVE